MREEGKTFFFQLLLQALCAIAIAASPGLAPVFIAALAAVMRVLHFGEIKIFFPVRLLFLKWCWAVADFDPAHGLVGAEAGISHIAKVFASRDGSSAECFLLDGLKQISFAAGFHAGSN